MTTTAIPATVLRSDLVNAAPMRGRRGMAAPRVFMSSLSLLCESGAGRPRACERPAPDALTQAELSDRSLGHGHRRSPSGLIAPDDVLRGRQAAEDRRQTR